MIFIKLRAVFHFYRTFYLFTNAITLGILAVGWPDKPGHLATLGVFLVWGKLFSDVGVRYLSRSFNRQGLWFYHNLGLAEWMLYGGAFVLDLALGLVLLAFFSLFA